METLEIAKRTIKIGVRDYGIDEKGHLKYNGTKIYPENTDPACFKLSDNTFYFAVADVEELTTIDNKVYSGENIVAYVYMGDTIPILDAMKQAPEDIGLRIGYEQHGSERVAVREDGYMSAMQKGAVTYREYCDQYKREHMAEAPTMKKI